MKKQIKHFVRCRCIVRGGSEPHQFSVLSIIDDNDNVQSRFVQCDNCGIVHRVFEICKSSIVRGEMLKSIVSIDDVAEQLPERLVSLLRKYEINDLATWEHVKFIIENKAWDELVVISRDRIDGHVNLKLLRLLSENLFTINDELLPETI